MAKPAFWESGIRFECQGTGQCCLSRGTYGFVYLSPADRDRMAAHLKLDADTFERKYCQRTEGLLHLNQPERDCQFLDGKRCGVYAGRPTQCRTWPFWPENMNAKSWNEEVAPYCAGVGKGRLHTAAEIREVLDQATAAEDALYADERDDD